MSYFTIEPGTDHVSLDNKTRQGSVVFHVQNKTGAARQVRAVVDPDPEDVAQEDWYSVREPLKDVGVDEGVQFPVDVQISPGVEAGEYGFRLKALAEDDPDDVHSSSQRIRVEVPEADQEGFPWWIAAIVGAVVLVVAVVGFLVLKGDRPPIANGTPTPIANGTPTPTPTVDETPTPTPAASPGVALAGYEVVSTDVSVPAAGFAREGVSCPGGTQVLGGGAGVIGEGSGDFDTVLQESSPGTIGGGARDVWVVAVQNEDSSAHTVRIKAVCASPLAGYEVVSTDVSVPAAGFAREGVSCPGGTQVLGGGAGVIGEGSGDFDTVLQESSPGTIGGGARDVWVVAVQNEDSSAHTVRIEAVCATHG